VIEIHLFGRLRQYATDSLPDPGTVVHVADGDAESVGEVLAWLGIDPKEVGNLFLNGRLLPRSAYPVLLGYPLAAERLLTPQEYLAAPVQAGDRVGIFPRNMGVVVV
jgi:hypothetical protein